MYQIEESLKSARLTHWILILVCATVLSLAFSPPDELSYSDANNELDAICKINLNKFIEESLQKVESLGTGLDIGAVYPKAFDYAMRHELEKAGFKPPSVLGAHEVFFTAFDEGQVRNLLKTRTVGDFRDFLSENIGNTFVFVQPETLAAALVEKIKDANIPTGSQIKGMKLVMSRPVYRQPRSNYFHIRAILLFSVEEPNINSALVVVDDPPVAMTSTYGETRFQNWLEKEGLLSSLIDPNYAGPPYKAEAIFPNLRPVWDLVADKTPEGAKRVLSDKVKEAQGKIAFFGVSIDAPKVVVIGPILVLLTLWYLWHLALHIRRICKPDDLCKFPWLPLFSSKGLILALIWRLSILVLPTFTLCLLYWRFRGIKGWPQYTPIILLPLVFYHSFRCWRIILSFRKSALSQVSPNSPKP